MTITVFPYSRRRDILDHITRVFLDSGLDAGNDLAIRYGLKMIGDLHRAGMSEEEISAHLDSFISAWRADALPKLAAQQDCGGAA